MKWPKNPFPASRRNAYREPTHHGRLPLYILQALQLLASVVVLGIMLYFVNQLRGSRMSIPWSFIIHLLVSATSTATIIILAVYAGAARPPAHTLILNGVLLGLWALSLGLLVRLAKATILSQCSAATWNNSTGMMVCRLYQTLFAFIIIALASTTIALAYTAHARHSNPQAYTKTSNPVLFSRNHPPPNLEDDASEFATLAPSSAPLSAPSYASSFRSPLPDDRSLGFPASPSPRGGDMSAKMGEGRRGVFQPPLASPGLLSPGMGGMERGMDRGGKDEDDREATEFSYLGPGGRYDGPERDLSA
ncbi:hypothetical protein V497_00042 [Pseudogymnoascus sp. VKM F-4516 (FW-969)]|nr:hypothetical protein V497_00042 [Pseudogymnoascus sp. VKM F-4516 (FW-969)]